MTARLTLNAIRARTVEVGDCWIWQQATSSTGYPIIKPTGQPCQLVRRLVVALDDRPAEPRQPVASLCNDRRCVNPAHLYPSTPRQIGRQAAARGAFAGPIRARRVALAQRASPRAKLTMEIARAIRASTAPAWQEAARYGVNKSLIKAIRAGRAWREYSSPWAGMGSRT